MNQYNIIDFEERYFDNLNVFWNNTGLGGSHRGDSLQIILDTINSGGHLLLMINEQDEIIGSSWLTNDRRRSYLHHFGIREDLRGRGLSNVLLERTLELARKDGYQIKLEVHSKNESALALYKKYGFNDLGDYKVMIIRDITSIS
jgi:ribosomal protein S18 acetylase RimI-like enzyme